MRKLVTIRKIKNIQEIENADNIEIAEVDGWKVVVRKSEKFEINKPGVYFEIDSFLPFKEKYMFLKNSSYKKNAEGEEGFRLKTRKLRGQLSQGLLLPLELFKDDIPDIDKLPMGYDLTKQLGVKLYEPLIPASLGGKVKGPMPSFIRKTEQERIQNLIHYFDEYKEIEFEISEKIDGSSFTCYFNNGIFGVCGRNWEWKETESNSYWFIARKLDLEKIMRKLNKNVALQAELAGPGINKNPLNLDRLELYLFDFWDIEKQRFHTAIERKELLKDIDEICLNIKIKRLLQHVPIIDTCKILKEKDSISKILHFANGNSLIVNNKRREGIVCKSTNLINENTISFKVVSNKYLLKNK